MSTLEVKTTTGRRMKVGEPIYNEVMDFLIEESNLLDHNLLDDWLGLLAQDISYTVPVRRTVMRSQGMGFDPVMVHMEEDWGSLQLRVARLAHTDSGYADDPPSRTRRFITNVRVHETEVPGEYLAESSLLLMRNRWDSPEFDLIPCARHDLLRRSAESFLIARREILLEQASVGTPNLAIFL